MDISLAQSTETDGTMRCPTCNAQQSWSDECRRCKCDLSDLFAVWRAGRQARNRCLLALQSGDFDRALNHAQRLAVLCSGDEATRLLTVCHLLRGDWPAAARQ